MYIKKEYDFNELEKNSWSGAISTLEIIKKNNKEEELMQLLEDVFCDNIPNETEVNDFLRFDDEYIFESLEIEKIRGDKNE